MKYIIKNCPKLANTNRRIGTIFDTCGGIDYYTDEFEYCKDITDCVLKRIVNECRNELEKRDAYSVSIHYDFARKILKFIEIEEAE